jgi:hypothetical protein
MKDRTRGKKVGKCKSTYEDQCPRVFWFSFAPSREENPVFYRSQGELALSPRLAAMRDRQFASGVVQYQQAGTGRFQVALGSCVSNA